VDPASESAKIIVNSRTGTIVIGSEVKLRPAAISHGGLTGHHRREPAGLPTNPLAGGQTAVTNNSTINVQQDPGRMFKLDTGATLDDLVRAVNQGGGRPGDLMAILDARRRARSRANWSFCNFVSGKRLPRAAKR
jgi:flagellar P-ring protein precursor FlgI